ncbi:MAG: rieske (2Fe-2S) domain protein [Pseudomonadota bacterium]|jgi:nitrite reductase/ring-hydroxylating ferredoxin subunit
MPWIPTISPTKLEPDGVAAAKAGDIWVALYKADDEFFATAVMCTHGQASLADGYLDGFQIECPLHQGMFDIRTGEPTAAPCIEPVRTFPVRLSADGVLEVEVTAEEIGQ